MKDYYAIMGLQRNASAAQIREKYLFLAKEWHPDVNSSPAAAENFKQLGEAYAILGDPGRRRKYDLFSKVREIPMKQNGSVDLIALFHSAVTGRVRSQFVEAIAPVLERKLDEHGVKARTATAEDILQAVGWLKPKRRVRRA